eukprot:3047210-Prymnesium_polylepis.1
MHNSQYSQVRVVDGEETGSEPARMLQNRAGHVLHTHRHASPGQSRREEWAGTCQHETMRVLKLVHQVARFCAPGP